MMKRSNFILIGIIILVTSALRLYKLFQIPFTDDEFSVIFRTHCISFAELIEKGVKPHADKTFMQMYKVQTTDTLVNFYGVIFLYHFIGK